MTDVLSPEQRSRCMSSIRAKNTQPEIVVRKILHRLGFRFRLHVAGMPGTPDIVLPKHRTAIFVHGCFWHRHDCALGRAAPESRAEFWQSKFRSTLKRDLEVREELQTAGWRIIVVWECETKTAKKKEALVERLKAELAPSSASESVL